MLPVTTKRVRLRVCIPDTQDEQKAITKGIKLETREHAVNSDIINTDIFQGQLNFVVALSPESALCHCSFVEDQHSHLDTLPQRVLLSRIGMRKGAMRNTFMIAKNISDLCGRHLKHSTYQCLDSSPPEERSRVHWASDP